MSAKPTEGEWHNLGPAGHGIMIGADRENGAICIVYGAGVNPDAQGNANAISALPELLKCCEMWADWCDNMDLPPK